MTSQFTLDQFKGATSRVQKAGKADFTAGEVKPLQGTKTLRIVRRYMTLHDYSRWTFHVPARSRAEVRFAAFRTSVLPLVIGHVEATSRDRLLDEMTRQPYFLTQVVVENVPREVRERLMARMPADVLRPTGERTVLDYLRALKDRINSVLREKWRKKGVSPPWKY